MGTRSRTRPDESRKPGKITPEGYRALQEEAGRLWSVERPRTPEGVATLSGIRELYTLLSGDYELTGMFQADRMMLANVTSSTISATPGGPNWRRRAP